MNIIYIHTHDTGRYIQPYGHNINTPNLMKLAKEGAIFRHAYCAAPTCSPSRSALLTGMAPHSCGMLGLAHLGFKLNEYNQHLVRFLKENGYETVLCGVQHEAKAPDIIGYDIVNDYKISDSTQHDTVCANAAAKYIYDNRDNKKPFFLSFGMYNTHRIFPDNNNKIDSNYVLPPFPIYDTRETREDMASFINSAGIMDRCTGIVLDALKKSKHEEDTTVIFTTDHGIAFPYMKCNLYDTGIGVALIIKCPQNNMKGKALDSLVSHVDIFPTLCDLANLNKPVWLQGKSMLPLIKGEKDEIRKEIFAEVTYHAAYEPMRCIRTDRYKLIRSYDVNNRVISVNIDDSPSKEFLIKSGYLETSKSKEMLFDLYLDPLERINVAYEKKYNDVYRKLSASLSNWMIETNDPIIHGKVEKPEGARVFKQNSLSIYDNEYE